MESKKITLATLFCPNCGQKIKGNKEDDGSLRITCKKCKSIIFSKIHNRKEVMMKVIKEK